MWLDTALHQAAGLHSFTPEQQLRVLPVVSQADSNTGSTELETLWQICSSLQRLSHSVLVLDGTTAESERAPGLRQLLGGMVWPEGMAPISSSLAVLPSAQGLAQLARRTGPAALAQLGALFRSYAVAVLYAPAPLLTPLVQASTGVPLIMTGPAAQGLVGTYRQLKHLALHAGPPACIVASVRPPGAPVQTRPTAEALATLQASAAAQLGLRVHTTAVAAGHAPDIQRLALQLLENACTMDASAPLGLRAPSYQEH